jgi:23S rRNA (cytosine1962-C5)-methyltransferase
VLQIHSIGVYLIKEWIVKILQEIYADELITIYNKSESTMPFKAQVKGKNEHLLGNSEMAIVKEIGLSFEIDWTSGQKTGFFVDQRENRHLLQHFSKKKESPEYVLLHRRLLSICNQRRSRVSAQCG